MGGFAKGKTFKYAQSTEQQKEPSATMGGKLTDLYEEEKKAWRNLADYRDTFSAEAESKMAEYLDGVYERIEDADSAYWGSQALADKPLFESKYANTDRLSLSKDQLQDYIKEQEAAADRVLAIDENHPKYKLFSEAEISRLHENAKKTKEGVENMKALASLSDSDYDAVTRAAQLETSIYTMRSFRPLSDGQKAALENIGLKDMVDEYEKRVTACEEAANRVEARKQEMQSPNAKNHKVIPKGSVAVLSAEESQRRKEIQKAYNSGIRSCNKISQKIQTIYNKMEKIKDKGYTAKFKALQQEFDALYDEYEKNSRQYSAAMQAMDNRGITPNSIIGQAIGGDITYNPVKQLKYELDDDEITEKLAGGDHTDGSCASLALSYAANRIGLDVTDFRGGDSQKLISDARNLEMIGNMDGINAEMHVKTQMSWDEYDQMLSKMEPGKEYFFGAAKHATIMRVTEQGERQYLELQSDGKYIPNGWTTFNGMETIRKRYGYEDDQRYYMAGILFDISRLNGNKDFADIMGYVNTQTNKQQKGDLENQKLK